MSLPSGAAGGNDVLTSAAFSRFYRAHVRTVYGYLLRLAGGDCALTEDLTQETFLALTTALKSGRTDVADIRWLLTVARTKFLDHLRAEERRARNLRLVASNPDQHEGPPPTREDVLEHLVALEPLHRAVLMLRYVDGLGVDAVASAIGRTVPATYSLLARARDEMRRKAGAPE
jgi:RNA polymerase sigma-70 factor (ECF subfamily)